jgi:hypothetical protein
VHPADLKNIDVDLNDIEVDTSIYINLGETTIMLKFRGCGLDTVAVTGLNTCAVQWILKQGQENAGPIDLNFIIQKCRSSHRCFQLMILPIYIFLLSVELRDQI